MISATPKNIIDVVDAWTTSPSTVQRDRELLRVADLVGRHEGRAHRAERVERLAADPLAVAELEIPRGDVVQARVPEDVVERSATDTRRRRRPMTTASSASQSTCVVRAGSQRISAPSPMTALGNFAKTSGAGGGSSLPRRRARDSCGRSRRPCPARDRARAARRRRAADRRRRSGAAASPRGGRREPTARPAPASRRPSSRVRRQQVRAGSQRSPETTPSVSPRPG